MKFQAHAKNLRLIQKAGYQEVDSSAGIPVIVNHPQIAIHFTSYFYETENEDEIVWLKRHRMFSETGNAPGHFWEYVAPRNVEAELAAEKVRVAELEAQLAEKAKPKEEPAKLSAKDIAKQVAKEDDVSREASTKETP